MRSRGEPAAAAMGRARRHDGSRWNLGWTSRSIGTERRSERRTAELCDNGDFSPSRDHINLFFFLIFFTPPFFLIVIISGEKREGRKKKQLIRLPWVRKLTRRCPLDVVTLRPQLGWIPVRSPGRCLSRRDAEIVCSCMSGRNNGSVFWCFLGGGGGGDNGIIPLWTEELCEPPSSHQEYFSSHTH